MNSHTLTIISTSKQLHSELTSDAICVFVKLLAGWSTVLSMMALRQLLRYLILLSANGIYIPSQTQSPKPSFYLMATNHSPLVGLPALVSEEASHVHFDVDARVRIISDRCKEFAAQYFNNDSE